MHCLPVHLICHMSGPALLQLMPKHWTSIRTLAVAMRRIVITRFKNIITCRNPWTLYQCLYEQKCAIKCLIYSIFKKAVGDNEINQSILEVFWVWVCLCKYVYVQMCSCVNTVTWRVIDGLVNDKALYFYRAKAAKLWAAVGNQGRGKSLPTKPHPARAHGMQHSRVSRKQHVDGQSNGSWRWGLVTILVVGK